MIKSYLVNAQQYVHASGTRKQARTGNCKSWLTKSRKFGPRESAAVNAACRAEAACVLREDHGQMKKGVLDAEGVRHRWSQPQALQLHDCHRMLKKSLFWREASSVAGA